jgi:hypothetical protein
MLSVNQAILKLDVDEGMERPKLRPMVHKLWRAGFKVLWMSENQSPGGKGLHIQIRISPKPETPETVTALQAILGSDPMREACNLYRARQISKGKVPSWMQDRWNVLYRK